ncbi:MAG TPA: chemotaxis response regulator protein-glutamate methylesterase [Jatrophihabitans sp.]|nr:chemotaxis response regulator protein-glutamate methylesterase [Jatrophihabitans sp.]
MSRIRVLIVDDSVVIRRLLADSLAVDPRVEVVATAANGQLALAKLATTAIDVVILDVEMPVLDGLQTLREIRRTNRRLPVIMFSTLTERGARITIEALASGASDYVTKPANVGSVAESREAIRTQLLPRVLALGGSPAAAPRAVPAPAPVIPARPAPPPTQVPSVLVIGSSTGGPEALGALLPQLPASLPVPVLIVQHMPPLFTTLLAERLNRTTALAVREAAGGEPLLPGTVYLAPGDFHLEVTAGHGRSRTALTSAPPEHYCRPSVDVLFRSAARCYGAGVLAVVLTGMGSDGRDGAGQIVRAGGQVLAQDRESSVVWGMPGAVAGAGLAAETLPLDQIAGAIVHRVHRASRASTAV